MTNNTLLPTNASTIAAYAIAFYIDSAPDETLLDDIDADQIASIILDELRECDAFDAFDDLDAYESILRNDADTLYELFFAAAERRIALLKSLR